MHHLAPMFTVLILLMPLTAGPVVAQEAEGEEAEEPTIITVPMPVGDVGFIGEVAIVPAPPADVRLLRADGESMADQGYLVAELADQACDHAGYRYDAGLPAILQTDGSWIVVGGCK